MANTRIKGKREITNTAPSGGDQNDKLLDTDLMLLEHNPNGNPDEDRSVKLSELRTYVTAILRQELQNGTLVVKKAERDAEGHDIDERFTDVEDDIDTLNSNDSTTGSVANKIKAAINALDVNSQGGAGKYIQSISETDGKISATAQTMDTAPTANSTKAVTSGGVKTALDGKLNTSLKGANSGLAELDANGKVPQSQLPSYVDDVLEYSSKSAFPATGESGKIYVATDTNKTYRWTGSAYTIIASDLALGETSSSAYRGDRGKTAYNFSQNPYTSTPAMNGTASAGNSTKWARGDHVHPTDTSRQPSTLATAINIHGESKTTVESALQGLRDNVIPTASWGASAGGEYYWSVTLTAGTNNKRGVIVVYDRGGCVFNISVSDDNVPIIHKITGALSVIQEIRVSANTNSAVTLEFKSTAWDKDLIQFYGRNATGVNVTLTTATRADSTSFDNATSLTIRDISNAETAIATQAVDCSTAGNVGTKEVALENFELIPGARLTINFENANTVTGANCKLSVNKTDAKQIKVSGGNVSTSGSYVLEAGYWNCYYDGTYWQLVKATLRDSFASRWSASADFAYYTRQTAACGALGNAALKTVSLANFSVNSISKATFLIWFQYDNTVKGALQMRVNSSNSADNRALYINGTISSATNYTLNMGIYMCTWNGTYFNVITDYMYGDTFTASGSNAKKGLVPQPPATQGTTKYLREDGTWAVPAGGGSVTVAPHFYVRSTADRFKILSIPEFDPHEDFYFTVLFTAKHNGSESSWDLVINNTHYSVYNAAGNVLVNLPYYDSSDKYVGMQAGTLLTFYYHEASGRVRLLGSSLMTKGERFSADDEELMDLWSDGKCRIYTVDDDYTRLTNLPFLNTDYTVSGTNFTITSKTSSALIVAKVNSNKPCCVICEGNLW